MLALFVAALSAVVQAPADTEKTAAPTSAEIRKSVDKSLVFLQKSSLQWRDERKCVTCHQIPFAIWPLNEARARGLTIETNKLDDLTAWSLDFCMTNTNKGEPTGGFLSTMGKMILALETAPKTDTTIKAFEYFEPLIGKKQREDGSWKEGNFIGVKDAEKEGIEVDTMWTILALNSMEKQGGDKLSAKARESLAKNRTRALTFLKDAKPATRSDWLALRMVVEQQTGNAKEAAKWQQSLIERQNKDGGWPFVKGGPSHPLVTGEALYLLSLMGIKHDDAVVVRAQKHLLETQRTDGSWKSLSRAALGASNTEKVNEINIHWGTGWATIGLLRTLPPEKPR